MFTVTVNKKTFERRIQAPQWKEGAAPVTKEHPTGNGYTPEVKETVEISTEIYRQELEVMDLRTIINAVNTFPGEGLAAQGLPQGAIDEIDKILAARAEKGSIEAIPGLGPEVIDTPSKSLRLIVVEDLVREYRLSTPDVTATDPLSGFIIWAREYCK